MELSFSGLTIRLSPDVYNPAEDSFMLATGASTLRGAVLEVGCGCGLSSLVCAKADRGSSVLGLDINPHAVECANENARINAIANSSFRRSDLFESVSSLDFDAIMFNPPYLPTAEDERLEGDINHAFDGGPDGRCVLDRFLDYFDDHMRPGGTLLLIQSSLNLPERTEERLLLAGFYKTSTESAREVFLRDLIPHTGRQALMPHLYIQTRRNMDGNDEREQPLSVLDHKGSYTLPHADDEVNRGLSPDSCPVGTQEVMIGYKKGFQPQYQLFYNFLNKYLSMRSLNFRDLTPETKKEMGDSSPGGRTRIQACMPSLKA